jgi:enterochelin esterase-like enzyme
MKAARLPRFFVATISLVLWLAVACSKKEQAQPDHPRLTQNVAMRDVTFHSAALNRNMQYRVFLRTRLVGKQEGLLPANHQFAALLAQRHFAYEFHIVPGGHNWNQWNERLASCFQSLLEHMSLKGEARD